MRAAYRAPSACSIPEAKGCIDSTIPPDSLETCTHSHRPAACTRSPRNGDILFPETSIRCVHHVHQSGNTNTQVVFSTSSRPALREHERPSSLGRHYPFISRHVAERQSIFDVAYLWESMTRLEWCSHEEAYCSNGEYFSVCSCRFDKGGRRD